MVLPKAALDLILGKLFGPLGLNILTRIFGLILTAIAVEIIANSLRDLFPVLRG